MSFLFCQFTCFVMFSHDTIHQLRTVLHLEFQGKLDGTGSLEHTIWDVIFELLPYCLLPLPHYHQQSNRGLPRAFPHSWNVLPSSAPLTLPEPIPANSSSVGDSPPPIPHSFGHHILVHIPSSPIFSSQLWHSCHASSLCFVYTWPEGLRDSHSLIGRTALSSLPPFSHKCLQELLPDI